MSSFFRSFSTNLFVYLSGTGAMLLFTIVSTFLIPKYMSVEGYGLWQLFMLYAGFVGILQLGFGEGSLIIWAKDERGKYNAEIQTAFRFLVLQQVAVIVPLTLILYFAVDSTYRYLVLLLMLFTFVLNLVSILANASQAARRFTSLSIMLAGRTLVFLIFVILLVAINQINYINLILAHILSWILVLITFILLMRADIFTNVRTNSLLWDYGKKMISTGMFVMLGNYIVIIFLSIDRLLVSSLLPIGQFAIYAFASTVMAFCYYFIKAVAEVFFPYITIAAPEIRDKIYRLGTSAIILLWAIVLIAYFPMSKLIELYLPDYAASLSIVAPLLCAVGFGSLIQVIHVNYYKVHNKQRTYFMVGLFILVISILLILLALKVVGTLQSIAIAMLCSSGIWYIINELCLKPIVKQDNKDLMKSIMMILGYSIIFLIITLLPVHFLVMTLVCFLLFSIISWLFYRDDVRELALIFIRRKRT